MIFGARALVALLCLVASAVPLCVLADDAADDPECAGCAAAFPEATAFLAAKGYAPDEYAVLLAWQESTREGLLTGYHVLDKASWGTFDLYSGEEGRFLDTIELATLGVYPKNWDLGPIEQHTELPASAAAIAPKRPIPVGVTHKALEAAPVELPLLDVGSLVEEDAQRAAAPGKHAQRLGVVRALPRPAIVRGQRTSPGAWRRLSNGGRLWAVRLISKQAKAIRVHFEELALPSGATLIVYNSAKPVEAYGPYWEPWGNDTDLWSASCFADSVTVECYVPQWAAVGGVNLVIDQIVHTYADFELLCWTKVAGACNQDVTCFSEWGTTALGVGAFTFIVLPDQLHCTGTLIADTDPSTQTPYFLTANHCVGSQEGAYGTSSMEFYWLYQTPACGESAPRLADVPRTSGGADLLATVAEHGSDFALVRLRNAPPEGLARAGWSTELPSVGTEVVCIHHPSSDYKRISFGTITDTGSPTQGGEPVKPYDLYHEVLWHLGTTERGSSGAPLFLADSQRIIGQLYGGYASCLATDEPDYFGRFDVTFPLVARWLAADSNPLDIDKSGSVTSADIQLVVNAALGMPVIYNGDVDQSGEIDAVDVHLVIVAVLSPAN